MTSNDLPAVDKNPYEVHPILRDDRYLAGFIGGMIFLLAILPIFHASRAGGYLNLLALMLFFTAMTIAAFRNRNALWVHAIANKTPMNSSEYLVAFQNFLSDKLAMRIVTVSTIAFAAHCAESILLTFYRHGGLAAVVANAFLLSMLFPASSLVGMLIAKHIPVSSNAKNLLGKARLNLATSMRTFLLKRNPYIAANMGFISFIVIASLTPDGVGWAIAGWLHSCALDANIGYGAIDPTFRTAVSVCTGMAMLLPSQVAARRLSAGFQSLALRLLVHGDNLIDSLVETTNVRSTKIVVPTEHKHLKNIFDSFSWLVFCYAVLFGLVAFCPPPLGPVITDWMASCVTDAGFHINLADHQNMRLFLASIFAGYGAVPVAIMGAAFLPLRRPKTLLVSAEGIISANLTNALESPMKQWQDLKKVSLNDVGTPQETLKLSFNCFGTIKLKTNKIEKQKVAQLLATADEHANKCKFDANVIALRSKLLQESNAGSLADHNKFAATIFSTKQIGQHFCNGKYRVIRKLAGKPMSAVYLARDQAEKRVIIKEFVLPSCVKQTDEIDQSFDREFTALSLLKHESIANVIETFEELDARYIVIEFIAGQDLRKIVQRRGRRDEKTVLRWAAQIATLMQFLHAQEPAILHRDLTPDNLMEDADGNIKLIDFGAAHQFMEGVTGTLIGKQCYIAPEQLRGKPCTQSDIYSFGCTLYFLLSGRDPSALEQCVLEDAGVSVHPLINLMLKRSTEFEVENRYQSFEEIVSVIEQASITRPRTWS